MTRRIPLIVVASACAFACIDTGGLAYLPRPSRAEFESEAGPILAKRCGDASCHGAPEHPYRVFAVGRFRMEPGDVFTSKPLTSLEIDANYAMTLGFLDAPRARNTTLVRKALGLGGAGGHKGGAVFAHPSDPECRALTAWIEGTP